MAEITWIKLRTNMFDDEKIKLLERLPDGDMIIVIWIKLLAQAGKVNCGGYIMIAENIPMTTDEMVILFNRPKEKISFALQALQRYGMIEIDENSTIFITNWEKHQNIEGMEKIRIQNAERQKRFRERKKGGKELPPPEENNSNELPQQEEENSNVTHNVTVTQSNATDIEKEKEKEKEYKDADLKMDSKEKAHQGELIEVFEVEEKKEKKLTKVQRQCKEIQDYYNSFEVLFNKRRSIGMSAKRVKLLKKYIDTYTFEEVMRAIENASKSNDWIMSQNWFDFNWIFKEEEHFEAILNGKYIDNYNTNAIPTGTQHNVVNVENLFGGAD